MTNIDTRTCNYYKNPRHIKAECRALKAKNEKAQKTEQMCNQMEEVNFYGATSTIGPTAEIISEDPNILVVENMVELIVLMGGGWSQEWLHPLSQGGWMCGERERDTHKEWEGNLRQTQVEV